MLKPMQGIEGTFTLPTDTFALKPGQYRIEASLDGWSEADFSQALQSELTSMAHPFLRGEAAASIPITLSH